MSVLHRPSTPATTHRRPLENREHDRHAAACERAIRSALRSYGVAIGMRRPASLWTYLGRSIETAIAEASRTAEKDAKR